MDHLELIVSDRAQSRICTLMNAEGVGYFLRIAVESGGCNGFQYHFKIDNVKAPGDLDIHQNGAHIVVDTVSADFLNGCTLEFVEDMMGQFFQLKNPNADSACGCGNSFSI